MPVQDQDIQQAVVEILATQALCPPEAVQLEARLETLGIDSLGLVEVIFAIEERFDVSVPFNANAPQDSGLDFATVGAVVEAVRGLVAAQAA